MLQVRVVRQVGIQHVDPVVLVDVVLEQSRGG